MSEMTTGASHAIAPLMSKEELAARIAALDALKPAAVEPDIVPICTPAIICFRDGRYESVCNEPAVMWPRIGYMIEGLLGMLPYRHRLDYWCQRIECGATIGLAFADSAENFIRAAGVLNCETDDDGRLIVAAFVCTFRDLDLEHVARVAESLALRIGAAGVRLWTPRAVPMVRGYQLEGAWAGQLQFCPTKPIQ